MTAPQEIHVVDDDPAVRDSLRMLLEAEGHAVRVYADAETFIAEGLTGGGPGCVVSDVRMPGLSGIDLLHVLQDRDIDMPLIVITGHADVSMAVQALKEGASDFIEKPFDEAVFMAAVNKALARSERAWVERRRLDGTLARANSLTPREYEVMVLVAQGLSNKAAAQELGISVRTVEIHRARVMEKMAADSLSALVRMVLELEESGRLVHDEDADEA
ncbi:Two-component nitrogen fixation transcriptional regulator FixJ [Paramagnetospirillum magnetotacticum MS-1]|uniref:Two-component nitrogen fixation transcriptional regulator FixJ n=1 Tax=Paramagnetospirillum magnetotacticum MS-1 TaxID=272627 RepID=A0A0C2YBA1_PARME|nr:response regulator [Paramagnetospirillum magnetotacticum]KIL97024.1 Two-component nitrogen fixation transcriptional regulator FixJ [Paramagnetospirillum magnetotacticum MS-1]